MVDPTNDDALAGGTAQGIRNQDSEPHDHTDLDAQRKAFTTLRARFAMAGFGLIELADGSYLATRWNWCRALPDLHAAACMLKQIGGAV